MFHYVFLSKRKKYIIVTTSHLTFRLFCFVHPWLVLTHFSFLEYLLVYRCNSLEITFKMVSEVILQYCSSKTSCRHHLVM